METSPSYWLFGTILWWICVVFLLSCLISTLVYLFPLLSCCYCGHFFFTMFLLCFIWINSSQFILLLLLLNEDLCFLFLRATVSLKTREPSQVSCTVTWGYLGMQNKMFGWKNPENQVRTENPFYIARLCLVQLCPNNRLQQQWPKP